MSHYFECITNEYNSLIFKFESDDFFKTYLTQNSLIDKAKGFGTTHLFIEENTKDKVIIGYYTLRSNSLIIGTDEGSKFGEPALEIAEFAVNKKYERQGIGRIMIKNIIATAIDINNTTFGIRHLILCSIKTAMKFYSKVGFKEIDDGSVIPREFSNRDCFAMHLKLPEQIIL